MPGRPRVPTEIKKLKGTYNSTRDKEQAEREATVAATLTSKPLRVSREVTLPEVKKAQKKHIDLLRQIGHEHEADSPELDNAYIALENAIKFRRILADLDIDDDNYDLYMKRYCKFFEIYNTTVQKFFLTPQARIKLVLDSQQMKQNDIQIQKEEQSAIAKLLSQKES